MVCTNQRGLAKTSFPMADGRPISWTSRYGSITFNQYGKEFPTGGMNEKGLVVELMWLDETQYPEKDDRPSISVLQWIQYQLDNCATVDEVIGTDKILRITATSTPLHYLVADANGNAATIEFLGGKLVAHKGNQLTFPVLTNSVYSESVQHARASMNGNNTSGNNSFDRFVEACQLIKTYKTDPGSSTPVQHAFRILDRVSQGDYTKWSIVYDITNRRILFKTQAARQTKSVSFTAFNFDCGQAPMAFDMNGQIEGDVGRSFRPFTDDLNQKILFEAAEASRSHVNISRGQQAALVQYAGLVSCD